VELVVQEDGAQLLVGAEQPFNGDPELTSRLVITFHGKIKDGVVTEPKIHLRTQQSA